MIAVAVVYIGLVTAAVGFLAIIRPMKWLHVRTRGRGAVILIVGLVVAAAGAELPAPTVTTTQRTTLLDQLVPAYQFNEVHSIDVRASPESTYAAMRHLTAREIRLFRVLTWIRSPHFGRAPESILNPPADDPVIDVALRSGFDLLADAPPREIVFGPLNPGGQIAMNFLITPNSDGSSHIRTETRIFARRAAGRRRFAPYWRVIYPGSSIIRTMWLRAIKARAERQ